MKFRLRKDQENQAKPGSKTVVCLLLVIPLALVIFAAIHTSHKGADLSELERKAESLQQDNLSIEMEIVKHSSLLSLSDKLDDMGFAKPTNVVYLDKNNSVAQLP